jgi:hypothetical protein
MIKKVMGFWSEERGLSFFLVILVVEMFIIGPMVRAGLVLSLISDVFFSILLLAGVLAMLRHRVLQWVAGVLVVVAIAISWASIAIPTPALRLLNGIISLASIVAFLLIVLWGVYRPGPVTAHRVRGAIAAYLLIGLCFSLAYNLVAHVHPDAFTNANPEVLTPQVRAWSFLYFSIVTLTTVGFGDITAVHPFARSLVMAEALTGQLYPAILIARLVSLQITARQRLERHADQKKQPRAGG